LVVFFSGRRLHPGVGSGRPLGRMHRHFAFLALVGVVVGVISSSFPGSYTRLSRGIFMAPHGNGYCRHVRPPDGSKMVHNETRGVWLAFLASSVPSWRLWGLPSIPVLAFWSAAFCMGGRTPTNRSMIPTIVFFSSPASLSEPFPLRGSRAAMFA
jgi:hypothetical protein